jgi:hypothetical protein
MRKSQLELLAEQISDAREAKALSQRVEEMGHLLREPSSYPSSSGPARAATKKAAYTLDDDETDNG